MKVEKLTLKNIGLFSDLELPLAPIAENKSNVTVLIGNNGSGKSTILNGMRKGLSALLNHIMQSGPLELLADSQLTNGVPARGCFVGMSLSEPQFSCQVGVYDAFDNFGSAFRSILKFDKEDNSPTIICYNAERAVKSLDVELEEGNEEASQRQEGYKGCLNAEVDFNGFFRWFREREDIENEQASSKLSLEFARELAESSLQATGQAVTPESIETVARSMMKKRNASYGDKQLTAVRNAIESFLTQLSDLRVKRSPHACLSVDKDGVVLNVEQLSQGEKVLLALIGDIARRMAILNPQRENPLHGEGIVLIDEADLHLHPQWQRGFISNLQRTFPNCQFVLTTHSPLMISDAKDVLVYSLENGECHQVTDLYGLDANQVLSQVMDTDVRNAKVEAKINDLLAAIQTKQLSQAQQIFSQLSEELPENHIELAKASLMLKKLEIKLAKT